MVKIVRKWPFKDYIKFHMTTGEKLKGAWQGANAKAPWITWSGIGLVVVTIGSIAYGLQESTVNRRKYSSKIEGLVTHDMQKYLHTVRWINELRNKYRM